LRRSPTSFYRKGATLTTSEDHGDFTEVKEFREPRRNPLINGDHGMPIGDTASMVAGGIPNSIAN
jgi:hypothetical protein